METFTPSIDWGNELVPSLLWIGKAWLISMVCVVVICVLLGRFTTWGRQFWRITGDYFKGRASLPVWGLFGALMLSVVASVRLDVLLSYYGNDLYSALQVAFQGAGAGDTAVRDSGVHGFWFAILVFAVLATVHVVRTMLDIYLMQRFIIRWRVWLTDRLTADWLDKSAYYRARFVDRRIDNPDQRIQMDIDIFTTGYGSTPNQPSYGTSTVLLFGAVSSVASVLSFAAILWNLSGELTVLGITIPKALFFIAIAYVLIATVIAFWIGRPLIRYSFRNEAYNAAFRYALVRLRDAAEAVGFYRGERAERLELSRRFAEVIANYRRYVRRTIGFTGWNLTASQAINPLPIVVQAPRLFSGEIALGAVMQSSTAFGAIHDGLSFFRNAYDQFAGYRAAIIRLHGLVEANETARRMSTIETEPCPEGTIELRGVEVRTPDGDQLIDPLDLKLEPGDTLVITGRSGAGKTTLLRSLAQLWPYCSGTLRRPDAANETMFLSQLPYVPLGDLRAVVSYPAAPGDIPDEALQQALRDVALGHLTHRLDEVADWAKVLSPGEQQRVAFARILLTRPKAVFLDESTSALDEGLEYQMYTLVRTRLPQTILVSVSHRPTVEQHHDRQLHLLGDGRWELGPVRDEPARV
ncbi:ABC transporter ATP-binding protein/permease [uncultured Mycolicibacterium sp.]|uniref:ABC transporter ATP-binding protein/permease n=1 Tax=uncultured Mycolicibacterium sp. TaxID=2320817 RepID=UPI002631565D|nr:ABC transporter ATP-binding protein/permease [uncultured Mycolicibacterium sp.]